MAATVKPPRELTESGLHRMEYIPSNPFSLFKSWYFEQKTDNHIKSNVLCLATATKNGKVSARSLLLRRLDEDGFVIMTDNRSKKCNEVCENPYAAMTFFWLSENNNVTLSRQVRAEGKLEELPYENWKDIFEQEPVFCKIRSMVCHQGQPVDWNELKKNHDLLLKDYREGTLEFTKPDHVVAYKMTPEMIEFYESNGPVIADRIMYLKQKRDSWLWDRIAA